MTTERPIDPLPLETARLFLRPVIEDDAAALFEIHADPEAMRYWSTPAWTEPGRAARVIANDQAELAAGRSIRLAIVDKWGSTVIGCCSLHRIDRDQRLAEVGYILRRAYWGRGLMGEAMGAVVAFAFDVLSLRRLEADLDPRNQRSARLLQRLGFRFEARLRERWLVAGEVSDSAIYGLLRTDPRPARTGGTGAIRKACFRWGLVAPTLICDDTPHARGSIPMDGRRVVCGALRAAQFDVKRSATLPSAL